LQKLSKNNDVILYSNNFLKVLYEFVFVLLVNISSYKIYLKTGHLIENFVKIVCNHKYVGIVKTWEIVLIVGISEVYFYPFVRVPLIF